MFTAEVLAIEGAIAIFRNKISGKCVITIDSQRVIRSLEHHARKKLGFFEATEVFRTLFRFVLTKKFFFDWYGKCFNFISNLTTKVDLSLRFVSDATKILHFVLLGFESNLNFVSVF